MDELAHHISIMFYISAGMATAILVLVVIGKCLKGRWVFIHVSYGWSLCRTILTISVWNLKSCWRTWRIFRGRKSGKEQKICEHRIISEFYALVSCRHWRHCLQLPASIDVILYCPFWPWRRMDPSLDWASRLCKRANGLESLSELFTHSCSNRPLQVTLSVTQRPQLLVWKYMKQSIILTICSFQCYLTLTPLSTRRITLLF